MEVLLRNTGRLCIAIGVMSLGLFVYHLQAANFSPSLEQDGWRLGGLAVIGILSFAALRLSSTARLSGFLFLTSMGLVAIVVDAVIAFNIPLTIRDQVVHGWQAANIQYDPRSRKEFINDLRENHIDAYPNILPRLLVERPEFGGSEEASNKSKEILLPLGGISNSISVSCNDYGHWQTYKSDKHGFNNPQEVWTGDHTDVVAIGDSFTEGICVLPDTSMVGQIRAQYPQTMNLGKSGDGPMLELATMTEYVLHLKPKILLWFYYEGNDLVELEVEKRSPLLMSYLEDGFSQNLITRQSTIDSKLKAYVSDAILENEAREFRVGTASRLSDMFLLRNTRFWLKKRIFNHPSASNQNEMPPVDLKLFFEIVKKGRQRVEAWRTTLVFVYLPGGQRFSSSGAMQPQYLARKNILDRIENLGIPIIDVVKRFQKDSDPLQFFIARRELHYTIEGQRAAGEIILERLKQLVELKG